MLEELMRLIREGGSFDTAVLAQKLNTTPEMVKAMMEYLARTDWIKKYQPGQSSCDYCSLAQMCAPEAKKKEAGHLWIYENRPVEAEKTER
jgi:hypothetical protein